MAIVVISLQPHDLVLRIVQALQVPLVVPFIKELPDSEIIIDFPDQVSLKNKVVIIITSTNAPVHDNVVRLALLARASKYAGAQRVLAVIPYFGYARQYSDHGYAQTELMIRMLECSGVDEFILIEPHRYQINQLFKLPVTIVELTDTLALHMATQVPNIATCSLVAPDQGALMRAQSIAHKMGSSLIVYNKQRLNFHETIITGVAGGYKGETAIIVDDMIVSGGTAIRTSADLFSRGIKKIIGYFIHPVLCADAQEALEKSFFTQIFVSNSIPTSALLTEKIKLFDISDAIVRTLISLIGKHPV